MPSNVLKPTAVDELYVGKPVEGVDGEGTRGEGTSEVTLFLSPVSSNDVLYKRNN